MSYKLRNTRILVIDDNMPIRMLVRSLLMNLGVGTVDVAENGEEGWTTYCLSKPDIIIVDWRMDKLDGLEFTKRVRRDPRSPMQQVPIIMMTGFTNKQRVLAARDAGVTEFIIKPFTVQAIARHITHVIENPRDFVMAPAFVGPDRRRKTEEVDGADKKRQQDKIEKKPVSSSPATASAPHTPKANTKYVDLRGDIYKPKE